MPDPNDLYLDALSSEEDEYTSSARIYSGVHESEDEADEIDGEPLPD